MAGRGLPAEQRQRRQARRQKGRAWFRAWEAKCRKAGLRPITVWLPVGHLDHARAFGQRIGAGMLQVLRAALELGLRRVTADDVIRMERQWRPWIGTPASRIVAFKTHPRDPKTGQYYRRPA